MLVANEGEGLPIPGKTMGHLKAPIPQDLIGMFGSSLNASRAVEKKTQTPQLNKALFSETLREVRCSSGSTVGLPAGPWSSLSDVKRKKP